MYHLLIADDEEEIRNGLATCFPWGEVGFQVMSCAENGRQALESIEDGGIDAVLTDIRMPGMSGVDLARIISERHLNVPVVFLSAFKDFAYAERAIRYGVRRYVLKPTDYRELTAVFTELKKELDSGAVRGGLESPDELASHKMHSDAIVDLIKEYVMRDYANATLSGAARLVHRNAQYVSRLFLSVAGIQFNQYLFKVKMTKAAELLSDVSYCTYEVSEMVGYSNSKNFARSFKRYFGSSPSQYRKLVDESDRHD